jgi:hypothetical protein
LNPGRCRLWASARFSHFDENEENPCSSDHREVRNTAYLNQPKRELENATASRVNRILGPLFAYECRLIRNRALFDHFRKRETPKIAVAPQSMRIIEAGSGTMAFRMAEKS